MLQQCEVERGEPIILAAILKIVCRIGPIRIPAHVEEAGEAEERMGPVVPRVMKLRLVAGAAAV